MRNILLATDGSESADQAARFLASLPPTENLALTVLTVVDVPYFNDNYLSADLVMQAIEQEKANAAEAYRRVEAMFGGTRVVLRNLVHEGPQGATIIEVADAMQADLVVLGARGHSRVERILLGSTSDYVATHARCSVLVVRPDTAEEPKRSLQIAVGYNETPAARSALEEIEAIHWGQDVEFHAVSVVSYLAGLFSAKDVDFETVRHTARATVEKAAAEIRQRGFPIRSHLIENPHAGEGLVKFAEDERCDLVVVGETPRSLMGRFLLGSVSRYVLRHAPCSVWIARPRVG